jgi:transcriptional regulator with XRE-family HTH domain
MPHPRLPAAPLKRVLKRLQASESLTWEELAERIGVTERHLCRILTARDLSERVADRISCRIGLHPLLLWPKRVVSHRTFRAHRRLSERTGRLKLRPPAQFRTKGVPQ